MTLQREEMNEGAITMATMTVPFTYTLTRVYDLREWDEAAEAYMDILPEEKSMCAHCGRLHAKVYEITRDQDSKIFQVGSSCSKKLFGWEPEQAEVKRLAKESEKLAKERGRAKLEALAAPIAEEVARLSIPEIEYLGTKYTSQTPCYGIAGTSAQVLCREGLTEERRSCIVDAWKREQVRMRVKRLFPENAKKCQKVQALAEGLLR